MATTEIPAPAASALAHLADRMWQRRLARETHLRTRLGLPIERLHAGDLEEAEDNASFARIHLPQLDAIPISGLTHADMLTHAFLRDALERALEEPQVWWGQFPVTPYTIMGMSGVLRSVFEAFDFSAQDAADRYSSLVRDYAKWISSLHTKLEQQARRGWRIPVPALCGVRTTLQGIRSRALQVLIMSAQRGQPMSGAATRIESEVERLVADEVAPAFDRVLEYLGAAYEQEAPPGVGLSQYPGGEATYRLFVRRHATYSADPEAVHLAGTAAVDSLSASMQTLRASLGFRRDVSEFIQHLKESGRLHARTPEDVEARYRFHMSRMAAVVGAYFSSEPRAPHDVARLDLAMEPGLSFGFYEQPTAAHPVGCYRYNGSGLDSRPQISAAALIFHELVPGHHFHLARQAEDPQLPAIRRESVDITAFVEGWAEYASDLGREMNLYDDPYDLYGRLVLDRFAAQRLVLDTGLNLLGWPLDRARKYMRENTLESDAQIASETLRYSTDLPGQALTYRLGFLKFKELRDRAERTLGARFDVRAYHEAILEAGALPLSVLERHVDWFVARESSSRRL